MKKALYFIIAISAVALVSCAKEIAPEKNTSFGNKKTITFSASIELNEVTKASLDGLDIKWSSSDHVFVAADNNATLQDVTVVPGTDKTQCEITIDAVEGASTYYFIYTGAASPSNLSFDTTTKTFSGSALTISASNISASSPSGTKLSMAGKASTTSLTMIPCLAMVKIKIGENSVKEQYEKDEFESTYHVNHTTYYSGVRGVKVGQKGSSTVYSSGLYQVNLSSDDMLVSYAGTGANSDKSIERAQETLLDASKTYIGFIIPGGSVSGLSIGFLGYTDATAGSYNYSAIYPMELNKTMTIKAGDCYDLGTFDPVTRQKTKDHAAYNAMDKPFTPVININGTFTDWDPSTNELLIEGTNYGVLTGGSKYKELRVAYDEKNIYFYSKRNWDDALWGGSYYYFAADIGNDPTQGSTVDNHAGIESYCYLTLFTGSSTAPVIATSPSGGGSYSNASSAGTYTTSDVITEVCIPRTNFGILSGQTIGFYSWGNKSASDFKSTPIVLTINDN